MYVGCHDAIMTSSWNKFGKIWVNVIGQVIIIVWSKLYTQILGPKNNGNLKI